MKGKWICWFSCGVTSAVAGKLAIDKYGVDNVLFYYIEIDTAHADNERFISDCEKWYGTKINRIRSHKYRDQFEVIEKTGYVNGVDGARCSKELKKEVRFYLEEWIKPNLFEQDNPNIIGQIFGFEFSLKEINRAIEFKIDYSYTNPTFILIENKLTKEDCAAILERNGIALPVMYLLGFNNNNCIGCTKGGKGYWNKIRILFPYIFWRMSIAEREAGYSCINGVFLDELDPDDGRELKPIVPECSVVCEDILTSMIFQDKANKILNGELTINEI
jgi:hypothetical protein